MNWRYPLLVLIGISSAGIFFLPNNLRSFFNNKESKPVIDLDQKHQNDKREYKAVTLSNDLEILLISDPSLNKSSAAMDVGVGSLEDPKEHLGLAHFLEHMLFLGTEKYPDIEEYNRFLHAYQGSSNAYTAAENTNYHFEVNHEGFEGSLDRFAQFFIAPTFNPDFVEREVNAVHSEHQKNLQDDYWRGRMVTRSLHKDGHPRQKFSTGDKETLKNVDRDTLLAFHKKYYSANRMKLAILSKFSIDELTKMVKTYFEQVPNANLPALKYDTEAFASKQLPRQIDIKSIKDIKKLTLVFPTPPKEEFWESKPGSTLSHLIGHEGKFSLLSKLKEENLVTSLSTWLESSSYAGMFNVEMSLTDEGLEKKDRVISLFFSFINLLKKRGYERYIYDERKTMGDINYVYRDLKEGSHIVANYASKMHDYPATEIDRREYLMHKYSREAYDLFLSKLAPDNLSIVLNTQDLKTDQVEPNYGTEFAVNMIPEALSTAWNEAPEVSELDLPPHNDFIPSKLKIISSSEKTRAYKLIENEWGTYWFQADDAFHLPKANVQLLMYNNKVNESPQAKIKALLYTMALAEGLNEWNYDISLAGLNYAVSHTDRGIQFDFSGYAENIPYLMRSLVEKVETITIDEKRFAALKDDLKMSISNTRHDVAYQQLIYELKVLSSKDAIHRDEIYNPDAGIDLISGVKLDDIKTFAKNLYEESAFEGSAYGSLDPSELSEAILAYPKKLSKKVIPSDARRPVQTVKFVTGNPKALVLDSDTPNHCWGSSLQFGRREPKLNAALRVGHAHLKTSFFTELRTKQQLGYIVHSGLNNHEKVLGMLFLIQSSEYSSFTIAKRVQDWKKGALEDLESLSQEDLDAYKQSTAAELREVDKTMSDRHQTNIFETLVLNGTFNYKERIASATEKLSKQDVIDTFKRAFSQEGEASLSVYLRAKDDKSKLEIVEEQITDTDTYRDQVSAY